MNKEVLDDFLAGRKGDCVGLIFFGSAAFVQAPFTEDLDAGWSRFHFLRPWWGVAVAPALWPAWMIRRHQDAARPWPGVIADHLLPRWLDATHRGPDSAMDEARRTSSTAS